MKKLFCLAAACLAVALTAGRAPCAVPYIAIGLRPSFYPTPYYVGPTYAAPTPAFYAPQPGYVVTNSLFVPQVYYVAPPVVAGAPAVVTDPASLQKQIELLTRSLEQAANTQDSHAARLRVLESRLKEPPKVSSIELVKPTNP